jgi:hypothetical protein
MGIVERELGSVVLSDGTEYTFEYNEGGTIHIHIDSMRVDMSVSEFLEMNETVQNAHDQLETDKNMQNE